MRTLLAGEGEGVCSGVGDGAVDCSGTIAGEGDSSEGGEGIGMGEACAAANLIRATEMTDATKVTMRSLSIVTPVHIRKNVVPPFAVTQKFFVHIVCDKLIVHTIESSKMVDCTFRGVFARGPGFHQKRPIA